MDAKLIVVVNGEERQRIPLKKTVTSVGRAKENDIRIPSGHVSRRHCTISIEGGVLRLRDLDSANGTVVNRRRVKDRILRPGDELRLGPAVFLVDYEAPEAVEVGEVDSLDLAALAGGVAVDDSSDDADDVVEAEVADGPHVDDVLEAVAVTGGARRGEDAALDDEPDEALPLADLAAGREDDEDDVLDAFPVDDEPVEVDEELDVDDSDLDAIPLDAEVEAEQAGELADIFDDDDDDVPEEAGLAERALDAAAASDTGDLPAVSASDTGELPAAGAGDTGGLPAASAGDDDDLSADDDEEDTPADGIPIGTAQAEPPAPRIGEENGAAELAALASGDLPLPETGEPTTLEQLVGDDQPDESAEDAALDSFLASLEAASEEEEEDPPGKKRRR